MKPVSSPPNDETTLERQVYLAWVAELYDKARTEDRDFDFTGYNLTPEEIQTIEAGHAVVQLAAAVGDDLLTGELIRLKQLPHGVTTREEIEKLKACGKYDTAFGFIADLFRDA